MTCTCKFQNRQVNLHLREESARREEALEREVWIQMKCASRFYTFFLGKIDTMEIHDSSIFDGFLEQKGYPLKDFQAFGLELGGAFRLVGFDWHVDEKTSCKLHSRHIPDPKENFSGSRLKDLAPAGNCVGVIWWSFRNTARQHDVVFKDATGLLHHALLNPWEPAILQGWIHISTQSTPFALGCNLPDYKKLYQLLLEV